MNAPSMLCVLAAIAITEPAPPAHLTATLTGDGWTLHATITLPATPCPANCDGSTAPPVLTTADFSCFMQLYTAGHPRANCDNSTAAPLLSPADFTCFLHRYALGCR